ncbi:MAG: hypothetical protein KGI66_03530 [Patescibacteria group bacterium]|nr:hypothetical protein [Patescibacteria group bacterium]
MASIVITIDGVLTDFWNVARTELETMTKKKVEGDWPRSQSDYSPFSQEEFERFLSQTRLPSWWLRMPPSSHEAVVYAEAFFRRGRGSMFDLVLVSWRPTPGAFAQTKTWLDYQGLNTWNASIVNLPARDALVPFLKSLRPAIVLTDQLAVVSHLASEMKETQFSLLLKPWNEAQIKTAEKRHNVVSVDSVEKWTEEIEAAMIAEEKKFRDAMEARREEEAKHAPAKS